MEEFAKKHKWKILLVAGGIIFVILCALIGWWALPVTLFLLLCYFAGKCMDDGGMTKVKDFFKGLFADRE